MINFKKIQTATFEELADILFNLDEKIDIMASEKNDACKNCEYYDEYDNECYNFDKWTNDICDPHGVAGRKTLIKLWLMKDSE